MLDSSLRVILCFFFHHHSDSVRRSRMTAELFLFCYDVLMLNECIKERMKNANRELSPLVGESVNRQVDERGKCEQKRKKAVFTEWH